MSVPDHMTAKNVIRLRPQNALAASISSRIGSAQFASAPSDALKDEDNAAWLIRLPKGLYEDWVITLKWVRIADRLSEAGLRRNSAGAYDLESFLREHRTLRQTGKVNPASPFAGMFGRLRGLWARNRLGEYELQPWDEYLLALRRYTPLPRLRDLADCELVYRELSGSLFMTLPLVPRNRAGAVRALGALDQVYNNVRDLMEDFSRGICMFPEEMLRRHGLNHGELPRQMVRPDLRFASMMEEILVDFAGRLRDEADDLHAADDLHPSWRLLLSEVFRRYRRIERVFRQSGYSAMAFQARYWSVVRAERAEQTAA